MLLDHRSPSRHTQAATDRWRAHDNSTQRPRIGDLLLAAGAISQTQLEVALARKARTGRRIGEELVASGVLTPARVSHALRLQRRLVMAALFATLGGHTHAAEVRAAMSVTAYVVDTVGI